MDVTNRDVVVCVCDSADKMSGYRTNTILCMPIKAIDGNIVGVIQAINKKDGTFSPTDEDVMAMLATQAGIALQNANLFRNAGTCLDHMCLAMLSNALQYYGIGDIGCEMFAVRLLIVFF